MTRSTRQTLVQSTGSLSLSRRSFLSHSRTALLGAGVLGSGAAGTFLAACGGSSSTSGPVTVKYTYPLFTQVPDVQLVADAMNKTDQFKQANIRVKLDTLDYASYDQKMQLGLAAGNRYDLMFTAPWANNFFANASKGNFLPLDDVLQQNTPSLYKIMPAKFWDATRINGKISSIPNVNFFAFQYGVFLQPDLAQKYAQYIPATLNGYQDMEPFLEQVKAHEPDVTPVYMADSGFASGDYWQGGYPFNFDAFGGVVGIRSNDTSLRVLNLYDTPEFKQLVQMRWRWAQAGYTKKDQVPGSTGKFDVQNGKYALLLGQQCKPNDVPFVRAFYGVKFTIKPVNQPFLSTGMIADNMNAVGRSSANPVATLKLSELINTDPVIFNLLAHGIEGKHYVFIDKAKKLIDFPKGVTATSDRYNPDTDWEYGNELNGYYTDPSSVGVYDQIPHANASAKLSPAFGFTFDSNPVKTQVAQVGTASGPLGTALNLGKLDPSTLPTYLSQIQQAGIDDIVAEAQRQLDAWKKGKK